MRVCCSWMLLEDFLREPNARDILESHYEELSPLKGDLPLEVDWEAKRRREHEGSYRIWTARVDGTLAGFIEWHIERPENYRGTLCAMDGVHYLSPAFRGNGRIGYRMWRGAEAALRDLGVRIIMPHDSADRSLLPFFIAQGYVPVSTLYAKVVR